MAGRAPSPKGPARARTTGGSGPARAGAPAKKAAPATPGEGQGSPATDQPSEQQQPGLLDQARASADRMTSPVRGVKRWFGSNAPKRTARQQTAHEVGGLLFGLIVYSLVINGIRYGTPGVKGWLSAKFVNRPMQGLAPSGAGGGGAAGGGHPDESLTSGGTGSSTGGVNV